jgi:uncharacterized RDD family membrane protein YckC
MKNKILKFGITLIPMVLVLLVALLQVLIMNALEINDYNEIWEVIPFIFIPLYTYIAIKVWNKNYK